MRAGFFTLAIAIAAATAAAVFLLKPFEPVFHTWAFALACGLAGLLLLAQGVAGLRASSAQERFASLGALGGALLCGALLSAAFAVGPPHLLAGAPGQLTPVGAGASVAVAFPEVARAQLQTNPTPSGAQAAQTAAVGAVTVLAGGRSTPLDVGGTRKVGQYVLRAVQGPIALVIATSADGKRVTITQPQGAAFASPYLLFPFRSGEQRLDYFAVPPLHRTVDVSYFPRYRDESRGIDIETPFVLVQIAEENGAALFRGPAVSSKPIHGGGVVLTFFLGQYPSIELASSPALFPSALAALMIVAGIAGYVWGALRAPSPAT